MAGICQACHISLNFPVNKVPPKLDFKLVNNTEENNILLEIFLNEDKLYPGSKFVIMVDGGKYGIEVCSIKGTVEKSIMYLKQFVLHYNGSRLVPVYVRYLKIDF